MIDDLFREAIDRQPDKHFVVAPSGAWTFAQFYRSLEAYRASFRNKSDVMVVDPNSDFFKAMRGSGSGSAPAPSPARK